jgi:glyoxylase-like metal-dependent hydrolase (beta-lactamase superfamily II)
VVIGEGHSVEQACLWCEQDGLLIAGDQILPSITPNVGVWPTEPKANPLKEFFQSLERFRSLPAETLVLPSHGLPFRGLRQRVDALVRHHQERLERCLTACRQPATATELLPTLFQRPLDSFQTSMAVGEALAHLHYLVETGEMVADTDAGGVHRFRCR